MIFHSLLSGPVCSVNILLTDPTELLWNLITVNVLRIPNECNKNKKNSFYILFIFFLDYSISFLLDLFPWWKLYYNFYRLKLFGSKSTTLDMRCTPGNKLYLGNRYYSDSKWSNNSLFDMIYIYITPVLIYVLNIYINNILCILEYVICIHSETATYPIFLLWHT